MRRTATTNAAARADAGMTKPRLGFIGAGWIGQLRMHALAQAELAEIAVICEPQLQARSKVQELAPQAIYTEGLDELLNQPLDGVVIATPSALHAEQAMAALAQGKAVFCQKPLARTHPETLAVIDAARRADRLLAVDFCYRHLHGVQLLKQRIQQGELGEIFSVELTFHNAYGPDKPWFYDYNTAGGGCMMDLGIHLLDLATWLLEPAAVDNLQAQLFKAGKRLATPITDVEDFASASFQLGSAQVQLTCSWNLNAGCDALISAHFYGTRGGACIRNVNGSFFDFVTERLSGTQTEQLAGYPEDWGGRALCAWTRALAQSPHYNPAANHLAEVALILDQVYKR